MGRLVGSSDWAYTSGVKCNWTGWLASATTATSSSPLPKYIQGRDSGSGAGSDAVAHSAFARAAGPTPEEPPAPKEIDAILPSRISPSIQPRRSAISRRCCGDAARRASPRGGTTRSRADSNRRIERAYQGRAGLPPALDATRLLW